MERWHGWLARALGCRGAILCVVVGGSVWAKLPSQAHHHYVVPKDTVFPQYMGRTPAEGEALFPKPDQLPLGQSGKDKGANWVRQWSDGTVYHQVRMINDKPMICGRSIGAYYRCEVVGMGQLILLLRVNISAQPEEVFADRSQGKPTGITTGFAKREITTVGAGATKTVTAKFLLDWPAPGTPQGIVAQRGQVVTEVWVLQWARKEHPGGIDIVSRCHDLLLKAVENSPMGTLTFDFPPQEAIPKLIPTEAVAHTAFGRVGEIRSSLSSSPPTVDVLDPAFLHMASRSEGTYSVSAGEKDASFTVVVRGLHDPFAAYGKLREGLPNRVIKGDWTGQLKWGGASGRSGKGDGGLVCNRTLYGVKDKKKEKPVRTVTVLAFQKGMFFVVIEGSAETGLGNSNAMADALADQVLACLGKECSPSQLAPRPKAPGVPDAPPPPEESEVVVRIEADGFHPRELSRSTKGSPSSLLVVGEIADGTMAPIAGATVSCPDLGIKATTNANGIFCLSAKLQGKGRMWELQETLKLIRVAGTLNAKLTAKRGFFANGRMLDCSLELLSDGKRLGNRRIYVTPEPDFIMGRDGRKSFCVVPGPDARRPFQGTIVLDAMGTASFQLPMPVWRDKRVPVREQEVQLFFPVIGRIQVRDLVSDKVCYAPFMIESPFPDVEKFSMVATHAGDWQASPASHLILTDKDADVPLGDDPKYFVELKAYGELRLAGTGNTCQGTLANNFQGRDFNFNYRPPADWSDKIKNPPDLAKRLGKAALKQIVSVVIDKGAPGAGQKLASMANKGRVIYTAGKGRDVYNAISTGINGWKAMEMSVKATDAVHPDIADAVLARQVAMIMPQEVGNPNRWAKAGAKPSKVPIGQPIREWADKFANGEIGEKHDAQIKLIDQVVSVWDLSNNVADDLAGETGKLFPKGVPKSLKALSSSGLPAEGLKMAYVLAKETYAVHRENWQIAMSYDEAINGRIEAWITDDDGHKIYVTRRPIVLAYRKGK